MRRAVYALSTALCLLLWLVFVTCFAVTRMGRDGQLYARCFHAFADTSRFGVPESDYDEIAMSLQEYFSGGDVAFPIFNARETTHLADIRGLFHLFDRAWILLLPLAAMTVWLVRKPDSRGFAWGMGLGLLILGALAAYIALDFENAFILMHRLLFTNDLWLLNPNTDVLICLMPEPMFTFLAGRLAMVVIPAWLILPTAAVGVHMLRTIEKQRGKT